MRSTLTFFFLLFFISHLSAQVTYICPPGFSSTTYCNTACLLCDLNDIEDTNTFPAFPPPAGLASCGSGAPFTFENPRWYAFIAGTTDILFEVRTTACTNNAGLEVAVVAVCPGLANPIEALTCASGGNPVTLFVNGLTVGQQYFMVVDGINGDICKYTISTPFGSAKAPELGPIGPMFGPTAVCPKALVTYAAYYVPNALTYTWTAPPGSKINGGTNVATVPNTGLNPAVEIEFGPVGGAVCLTASNLCDTPKTICIQVTNMAIPITVLPDLELCYEELPFVWDEQPNNFISAPGTYTFTSIPYQSYLGCDSVVRQKIIAKQRKFKILPPTWLCKDECFKVGDFEFCDAGTYSEALTAADGCDSLLTFTLIKIPAKAGIQKPDTLTCRDPSTVLMADSTITTGNTVTYKWVNDAGVTLSTTTSVTVSTAGPFYFIVTNYGGGKACSDTAVVTVPVNQTAPISNAGPNRVLTCANSVIQLQGSGSTGPLYTYLWLAFNGGNIVSGSTTLTPTINAVGSYRLRVTNQHNGCTSTDNTIVTADQIPPTISATGGTFNCIQPMVTLQTTTGASGPTYAWTGPNGFTSTQPTPSVNVAGQYTVVVTDSITGCTNSALAVVIANTDPPGAMAVGGVLTCVEDTVQLSGTSPANNPVFAWSGPAGFTSNLPNPIANTAGNYIVTVTGGSGCTSTAIAVVIRDTVPPGASIAVSSNLNCNNSSVNLTASSTTPATFLNHVWTRPNGTMSSTGANPLLAATAPGAYTVLITNTENGCTSTANAAVVQSPAVTAAISAQTNVSCFGQQNGSATASGGGGNGTFNYQWNTGDNTPVNTGLTSGTYTVTITDGEQCSATATVTITQPPVLTANTTSTPQMANGQPDGTATATPAGGTPMYTYLWSNNATTANVNNLLPGTYTVTVTDANGCTAVSIATVNAYNCTINADVIAVDVQCFDANNGMATAVTTAGLAPFTYLWSTGDTTVSISGLQPGIYTVTVTDDANCPEAVAFTISEPTILRGNVTSTNMTGPSTGDGSASSNPTGGTAPYTFEWSTGETTATINNLAAGTYTLTVTDANGCTIVRMVAVLPGNCGITTNFIATPVICNGQSNGSATIVLNGGSGPFSYLWSSGDTTATAPMLAAGTYTVSVVDANGCELFDEVTINQPPALSLQLDSVVNTTCANAPEGSATVIAGGGVNPVAIKWSNGQTGPTATNLIAGTYTVSITDANECKLSLEVMVAAIDLEPPVIATDSVIAPLGVAGNITLSVQNLGLDVSDNCAISEVTFQPASYNCTQLGPHNVVVTAIDISGNITVDTIVVTVVDNLQPTLVCPPSVVRCFGDDVVQYSAPVATDNCLGNGGMFDLISGFPSGSTYPEGTTTNTYTYTDADGNVGSCTFEVTILTELVLELDTILPDKGGLEIGGVYISVSGSLSPYTFQWFNNGQPFPLMTEDLDSVGSGSYTVIITDEVGCTTTGGPWVIDSLTKTNSPAWASGLLIMPNPTSGQLSVVFPNQMNEEVQLTVFDMTGRRVLQQTADAPKQVDFDLSSVPQGMYTVLIRVNQQVLARKIVVSR